MATNYCGECKHWHPHEVQEFPNCRSGDCDKIQKGTKYQDGEDYEYDGWSFEDECYDECLHCFERKGNTTYWYGIYDSAYVCKNCECSMPMCADGDDVSRHFKYCPFCGLEITAFYASEVDAEFLEAEKNKEVAEDADN